MKKAFQFVGVLLVPLFLVGCKREPSSPPTLTPKVRLVAAAKAIVSNPNNWKVNSSLLTDFTDAAAELNLGDKAEVKEFKSSAEDLIKFGTTWISSLNETESHKFAEGVNHIVAGLDSKMPGAQGAVELQVDSKNVQRNAANAIGSSTSKLTPEQAEQFGKLFSKAVDSYEKIYKLGTVE